MTQPLTRALTALFCAIFALASAQAETVGPQLPLHAAVSDFCARPSAATLHDARNSVRSTHLRWMAIHHIEQAQFMRSIAPQVAQIVSPRTWRDGERKPKAGAFDQSPTQRTLAMIGVAIHGFSSLKRVLFDNEIKEGSGPAHKRQCERAVIIAWYISRLTELASVRHNGLAPQDVRSLWRAAYIARSDTARSKGELAPFSTVRPLLANHTQIIQRHQNRTSQFEYHDANAFVRLFEGPYRTAVGGVYRADILQHTIMDLPARRLEAYLSHYIGEIREAVILTLRKPDNAPLTGS